jgi:hypothetical protein
VASRGTQRSGGLATDPRGVKRDGRGAKAPPICWGATHGEAEAHEGQVDCQDANRVLAVPTDSHVDKGPEDGQRRRSQLLGDALRALRFPHLGRGEGQPKGRNVKRAFRR